MISLLLFSWPLLAQQNIERMSELAPVKIFGSSEQFLNRPVTPKKITKQKIETQQLTDINRALKQTSGVYTREEDGQGLRANIGLRGSDPDRSKKISLLEDGVLIGPAPYSAPAAYYTPSTNNTESIEVYKGFAGLPFGPNSIGGAVNFNTPSISYRPHNQVTAGAGSFATTNIKVLATAPTSFGGYLLQGSRMQTEGFKELDGGGSTGYLQNHFLGKVSYDFKANQNLLLTTSFSNEDSHETYLGITESDFYNNPYRRYSSSALDEMKWEHYKVQVRHQAAIGEHTALETAAYRHQFQRTWHRLDRFRNDNISLREVLRNPYGVNAPYYDVLRGNADSSSLGPTDGQLVLVNNHRTYLSQGLQSRLNTEIKTGNTRHNIETFLRFHADEIRREHTANHYEMLMGQLRSANDPTQTETLNRESAQAITASVLDNWDIGPWTLTSGLRFETASFTLENDLNNETLHRSDSILLPGVGVTRKIGPYFSARTSVNRAATLTGLSIDGSEQREEALNYEIELKYSDAQRRQEASITFFYNDYRNITGTCTTSGGCSATEQDKTFNGGKARINGAELEVNKEFRRGPVSFPVQLSATYLQAMFESDFSSSSPDWGVGRIQSGDPLPYIPDVQYSASLGSEFKRWRQDFIFSYQGRVYDQAAEGRREISPYGIIDWNSSYTLDKDNKLLVKVDNVLDRQYIVASRPFGVRPGKPQAINLSWVYQF